MIYLNNKLLKSMAPSNRGIVAYLEPLMTFMQKYGISDNELRVAHFMAQVLHESNEFKSLIENLNYSADGLLKIWPNRFTKEEATMCARHPQVIACIAYENRMGNGDRFSKDGWAYCGRGLIQITGKSNYEKLAKELNINIKLLPGHLETMVGAVQSACHWWAKNGCNELADHDDVTAITKKINGGTNGLDDRKKKLTLCKKLLREDIESKKVL